MEPRDVFISYTEQDGLTARALAAELRKLHLTTWTYEEDGVVGVSYLTQINAAIESCRAFVLLASPNSVNAHQVIREVEQAHEREKVIIPARVGMSHQQFIASNPILRMACGTAVTLAAEEGKLATVAERIASGLRSSEPLQRASVPPISTPPTLPASPRPRWRIAAAIVASAGLGLALLVWTYKAPVPSTGVPVAPSSTAPSPPANRGDSGQPEVQKSPEPAKTLAETKKTPSVPTSKPANPAVKEVVQEPPPDRGEKVLEVPPTTDPSPDEARRQLLSRARQAVNCLIRNQDDSTARIILIDVFHRGTSIPRNPGGILNMLDDEFKGATEVQQSEIVKKAGRCGEGR